MLDQETQFEDVSQEVLDNEIMEETMDYFYAKKEELGYETVWSMYDGALKVEDQLFVNQPRLLQYKFKIDNETHWTTATTKDGTIGALWAAAEEAYVKANKMGNWHYFIEDFTMEDDGSLTMVMGS
jgi:hypothetical protein